MKPSPVIAAAVAVVLAFLCVAGCTTPQGSGAGSGALQTNASTSGTGSIGIDTTIPVHFDDYACLDVQAALGKEYLYPDEKYILIISPPAKGGIVVTVLLLDFNDNLKLRQTRPLWDPVRKIWTYEGIVPLIQLNDVTTQQQQSVTIKKQGKYFVCVDDRKEMGVEDKVYTIPVKFSPVS